MSISKTPRLHSSGFANRHVFSFCRARFLKRAVRFSLRLAHGFAGHRKKTRNLVFLGLFEKASLESRRNWAFPWLAGRHFPAFRSCTEYNELRAAMNRVL